MNNGILIQHIVFQNITKLNTVTLRDIPQGFARLDGVDAHIVAVGFGLHIDNLVLHGLVVRTRVVEFAQIFAHHHNILRDFLVSVSFFGNDEVSVVVFEHLAIGERTLVGRIFAAEGGEHLLAGFFSSGRL